MIKGHVHICSDIKYKIYATDRREEGKGKIISETKIEALGALVKIYDSGAVVIQSPDHDVYYNLSNGYAEFS